MERDEQSKPSEFGRLALGRKMIESNASFSPSTSPKTTTTTTTIATAAAIGDVNLQIKQAIGLDRGKRSLEGQKSTQVACWKKSTTNKNHSKPLEHQQLHQPHKQPPLQQAQHQDEAVIMKRKPLDASIRLIEAGDKSRALRQINIVGQLNHSASRGMLLLMNSLIFIALALTVTGPRVHCALWPFKSNSPLLSADGHQNQHQQQQHASQLASAIWPARDSTGKRWARNSANVSGTSSSSSSPLLLSPSAGGEINSSSLPAPPISQQFHYFWNHDQLEPKTMASEAQKILAEAQLQTNELAMGGLERAGGATQTGAGQHQHEGPSSRQDSMQSAASDTSMLIPPGVQQQLTSMVLQMQRQQQLSMMMQPRFDAARRMALPMAAPVNPMSRYWMAGSSQHPVVAAPPPLLAPQSPASGAMAMAESIQSAAAGMNQRPPMMTSLAGVPVYGPFLVAPTMAQQALQQASMFAMGPRMAAPMALPVHPPQPPSSRAAASQSSSSSSKQPAASRFASSLLSRRKSWPIFGLGSSSPLSASSSQPRPTVMSPPQASLNLAPETVALIDMASKQLASAIASHMQAGAARQRLADQSADMHGSASVSSVQHASKPDQTFSLSSQRAVNLQPPYLMAASLLAPAQMALSLAQPLLTYTGQQQQAQQHLQLQQHDAGQQPAQSFDLSMFIANHSAGLPFGSRLKRRHLNGPTQLKAQPNERPRGHNQPKALGNPRYSIETFEEKSGAKSKSVRQMDSKQSVGVAKEPTVEEYYSSYDPSESIVAAPLVTKAPHNASKTDFGADFKKPSGDRAKVESRRIVKKDKPAASSSSSSRASGTKKNELRHLFMLMATESPISASTSSSIIDNMFEVDDNQEAQTQLRRLRRSLKDGEDSPWVQGNTSPSSRKSRSLEFGWRLPSTNDKFVPISQDKVEANNNADKHSSVSWTPTYPGPTRAGQEVASSSIVRRQAEIASEQAIPTVVGKAESPKSASETVKILPINVPLGADSPKDAGPTKAEVKVFKVKRITANASVMHSPPSKSASEGKASKKIVVMSGTPITLRNFAPALNPAKSTLVVPSATTTADPLIDPMSASLSESARVVNYFQNVENDSTTARPQQQQYQQQTSSPSSAPNNQAPQLSVGYPAPSKSSRVNEQPQQQDANSDDIRRQNQKQQQQPGNGRSETSTVQVQVNPQAQQQQQYQRPQSSGGSASGSNGAVAVMVTAKPRLLGSAQQTLQQLSSALAASADISSAATGDQAYINSAVGPTKAKAAGPDESSSSSSGARQVGNQKSIMMTLMSKQMQPNGAALGNHAMSFQTALLNTLLSLNESKRRSSMQNSRILPAFRESGESSLMATSMSSDSNRIARPQKDFQSSGSGNSYDRSAPPPGEPTGTNYINEEPSAQSQPHESAERQQSYEENRFSNEQLPRGPSYGGGAQDQAHIVQAFNENFGARNSAGGDNSAGGQNAELQHQMSFAGDSASGGNQQFRMSNGMMNSTDSFVPDSSMEPMSGLGQPNSGDAFTASMNQQVTGDSPLSGAQIVAAAAAAAAAAASAQSLAMTPVHQQQQYYSNQLQALSTAVSNLNQARFNQHQQYEDPVLQNQRFSGLNQQFEHAPMRNYLAGPSAHPGMFSAVDEDAAANTAAAAGIPTYPSQAFLMAMQGQGSMNDLSGMLMAGSEKREQGDGESGGQRASGKAKSKGAKKTKDFKQISHHYHFNNLMSPFEDGALDTQIGQPFNPLDIAGNLQQAEQMKARQRAKAQKDKEQEEGAKAQKQTEEEEQEEQKPKKKGFLRRFSLKNLFKRFKKDKNKGQASAESEESNNEKGSNSSNGGDSRSD